MGGDQAAQCTDYQEDSGSDRVRRGICTGVERSDTYNASWVQAGGEYELELECQW